jgi:DNA-directed RNA polymerase specialized sigma24 family protein
LLSLLYFDGQISRLDFDAFFYLDQSVPAAADDVTSLSAIGGSAQHRAVAFTTTHWSVVLTAQGESPAAEAALDKLCRTYWRPLYSFVRRQGVSPAEAQDLTQGFFALLLERRDLDAVRKEKGRLRSYLLASIKHFLADERRRAMAIKRGKGQRLIPFDELCADERSEIEAMKRLGWTKVELARRKKGDAAKVALARRLRSETAVSLRWIAEKLHMGTWTHVSNRLYHELRKPSVNT